MSDIIQLLPDSVANQIAAGEVIQRPASVVKELLENSIDAGSTSVQLIVKDAGKTLIQLIDNGCGMSDTDARMSFERHATSKIREANDLFAIQTKGFRGEALASIAAIAHVELKTRQRGEQLGTSITVEGTTVTNQEACSCPEGTQFLVKNLFFNVPARRHFLKSDGVETRHIIDEFQRVALTHPDVAFVLKHNDSEVFNLHVTTLRQRIVAIFGAKHNQRLVPVEQATDILNVFGYVGKPEFARKTRGEQFIFVNNRFIKSSYLNHAITSAYHDLLPKGMHPSYFLYLEIDPSEIDINIHPTKTEIKFKDERSMYAIIQSSVKNSLGKFNIVPSIDFEQEASLQSVHFDKNRPIVEPQIEVNPNFNPFETERKNSGGLASKFGSQSSGDSWKDLYKVSRDFEVQPQEEQLSAFEIKNSDASKYANEEPSGKSVFQLHNKYLVSQVKSGMIVIDQHRAHVRVLYEKNLRYLRKNCGCTQQMLFPQTVDLPRPDFELITGHLDEIRALGFEIEEFGSTTLKISGIPADSRVDNPNLLLEGLIDQLKNHVEQLALESREKLALALAESMSIKSGTVLQKDEIHLLIDELFACEMPWYTPNGKATITTFTLQDLMEKFD